MNKIFGIGSLLLVLMSGLIGFAQPAFAVGCPDTPAVPSITSVKPGQITAGTDQTITITGTGFEEGVIVVLEDYGVLLTSCINQTVVAATVPATVPADITYDVTVINPTEPTINRATRNEALRVLSSTIVPTSTPAPTNFVRPLITVDSYGASSAQLRPGESIDFEITFRNRGGVRANDVTATFVTGDLIPRSTGGVLALGNLNPNQTSRNFQPFTVNSSVEGPVAVVTVEVEYTDPYGALYSETFTLSFAMMPPTPQPVDVGPTPTPTPQPNNRPQLVIGAYTTDVERLFPGNSFAVSFEVGNQGMVDAETVTMIVGGMVDAEGNPGAGDFSKFSPVGSSNLQTLGDVSAEATLNATQQLVVNVTTEPGAYPLNIVFTYTDPQGNPFVDQQVITLLVYSPVQVDISTYREPDPLFAGNPATLPLQVVNSGRKSIVLGTLDVTVEGGQAMNPSTLIGLLDMGGFYIADVMIIADAPGPVTVILTLNYTDDFNQPQTLVKTYEFEAMEGFFEPPPGEGFPVEPLPMEESFMQMVWRFLRGLVGLDSARTTPGGPDIGMPIDGPGPIDGEIPYNPPPMKGP